MDLNLKLGLLLREDIFNQLIKFISILNGKEIDSNDKIKLCDDNYSLVKRLMILSHKEGIDENLNEDLNKNKKRIFFELSWKNLLKTVDVLNKSLNADILSQEDQDKLVEELKNVVLILINLNRYQPAFLRVNQSKYY